MEKRSKRQGNSLQRKKQGNPKKQGKEDQSIALCFPGIAPYRVIPPMQTPIALTFASMRKTQNMGGVSHVKLLSEGYRAIGLRHPVPPTPPRTPQIIQVTLEVTQKWLLAFR